MVEDTTTKCRLTLRPGQALGLQPRPSPSTSTEHEAGQEAQTRMGKRRLKRHKPLEQSPLSVRCFPQL